MKTPAYLSVIIAFLITSPFIHAKSGPMSKALHDNFDSYYSNAKKSGFSGGSVSKESTVSGFQQMNNKLASIKQEQFSKMSKERYNQHKKDVADGKIKDNSGGAEKDTADAKDSGTYNSVSGSSSSGRSHAPTTGMTAGAGGGAKIVTFGSGGNSSAQPTANSSESKNPK